MDLEKLKQPFNDNEIEWRVQHFVERNNSALLVPYITNRAVQNRLDDVCGCANWKNEYHSAPNGGVLCGISIKISEEWITKYDGADNTEIENVKGGLSNSMKRAAVLWGIGRHLYTVDSGECWVQCTHNETLKTNRRAKVKTKDGYTTVFYEAPKLSKQGLPLEPEITKPVNEKIKDKITSSPEDVLKSQELKPLITYLEKVTDKELIETIMNILHKYRIATTGERVSPIFRRKIIDAYMQIPEMQNATPDDSNFKTYRDKVKSLYNDDKQVELLIKSLPIKLKEIQLQDEIF